MWSSDFEIAPGESFGEWLHAEIAENAFIEQHGFMPDRVRTAAARLQRDRPDDERFVVEVPWLDAIMFFRAMQKRIYSPERELDADRRAIDPCMTAGYDPGKCLSNTHGLEVHPRGV